MNIDEICQHLGVDEAKIEEWMTLGLPFEGTKRKPEFNEYKVTAWLLEEGIAQLDDNRVAKSLNETAKRLGFNFKTVHGWSQQYDFPGCPGYYPLEKIDAWQKSRQATRRINQYMSVGQAFEKTNGTKPESNGEEHLTIKQRRDLLKLKQEEGELVLIEEVRADMARAHSFIITQLNQIAGKIEVSLPASLDEDTVHLIRDTVKKEIKECCEIIAEHEQDHAVEREEPEDIVGDMF